MNSGIFTLKENISLAQGVHRLVLEGDTSAIKRPGQFVDIKAPAFFLRRPFSVCEWDEKSFAVTVKTVAEGTKALSALSEGTELSVLTGLGNGFDTALSGSHPVLFGGGSGVSPMLGLAKALREEGKRVSVVLGFNTASEIFYEERFIELGCELTIATVDGSRGVKGFVTDAVPGGCSYSYACGPIPMLKAIYDRAGLDGEYSFEKRMGCGFGACMGCTQKVKGGLKRICKDGPVLKKEEILWED